MLKIYNHAHKHTYKYLKKLPEAVFVASSAAAVARIIFFHDDTHSHTHTFSKKNKTSHTVIIKTLTVWYLKDVLLASFSFMLGHCIVVINYITTRGHRTQIKLFIHPVWVCKE